jgi:FKBP-type peptidyl-prolyl cis-trans isomerase FkpA
VSRSPAWLAALGAVVFSAGGCATPRAASPAASAPPGATKPTVDAAPPQIALVTDEDKTFYALGKLLGRNIRVFQLTPQQLEIVKAGIAEAVFKSQPERIDIDVYGPKVDELAKTRAKQAAVAEKARGNAYRATVAQEPGAETLPSGTIMMVERAGDGASPDATNRVTVDYEGRLIDGTPFDSSYKRGKPATFPLTGVIRCWTNGIAKMRVGGKARLVCPPDQAYGDKGRPPSIPSGATLIFDVELISIAPPEALQSPISPN